MILNQFTGNQAKTKQKNTTGVRKYCSTCMFCDTVLLFEVCFALWSLMGPKHGVFIMLSTQSGFGAMRLTNLWLCCASHSDSGRRRRLRANLRRLFSPSCCPSWPALLRALQRSTLWPRRPPSTLPRWAKSRCPVRRARVCLMSQLHCCCSCFMNGGRSMKPLLPQC